MPIFPARGDRLVEMPVIGGREVEEACREGPEPLPPPRISKWEAIAPVALLATRAFWPTATPFYLDWIVVLSVYWLFFIFWSGRRFFETLTTVTLLVLLAVYLLRTIPLAMDTLRLCT